MPASHPLFVTTVATVLSSSIIVTSLSAYSGPGGLAPPGRRMMDGNNNPFNSNVLNQQEDFAYGQQVGEYPSSGQMRYNEPSQFQGNYYSQPENQGYDTTPFETIQGQSRSSFDNTGYGRSMGVRLETEQSRPMEANVGLWDGPDNTYHQTRSWSEDGQARPFQATMSTSSLTMRGNGYNDSYGNNYQTGTTMDVQNRGSMEYPLMAGMQPEQYRPPGYINPNDRMGYGSGDVKPMSYFEQMSRFGDNNRDFGVYNQGMSNDQQMSGYENNRNYGGYNQGMSNGQQMSGYNSNSRDFGVYNQGISNDQQMSGYDNSGDYGSYNQGMPFGGQTGSYDNSRDNRGSGLQWS
mmetsp:Transcript_3912/g.5850  ORF Transcript_3912/g.5850 Transcript_3912/m.5850 type:complete len:349 (-) Transcript_3912:795-1841(-)